jgi:hypothetical protein
LLREVWNVKRLLFLAACAALLGAPAGAWAQSSMMPAAGGNGPHAFDWMIGTWTCKNSVPTALAGPAVQTLTATRSTPTGAIVWRYTGANYDQYGFLAYSPTTKTWWSSWAYPGGGTGNESTKQTGHKTMWTGKVFPPGAASFDIRDTFTVYGATKFNDTGEDHATGSWKPAYNGTCTKSS